MTIQRERPKVITLTDVAAARVKEIMARGDNNYIAVRLGVDNGGCAGMAYTMNYAEEQNPLDEVVIDKGVQILIDPKAILFLIGTEMDYQVEQLKSGFIFKNPNQTDACGCGESVTIKPAVLS